MFFLIFNQAFAGGTVGNGEPPTPRKESKEDMNALANVNPGELCFLEEVKLVKRHAGEALYECKFTSPSNQSCNLQFKIWREPVDRLPDGSQAPPDFYEVRASLFKGKVSDCSCGLQ